MSIKYISYLELWQLLCWVEWNHLCNFGRGYYEEQFCEIIWIWLVFQEMPFNDISYLELWWTFCWAERNYLYNFGWGYQEEKFFEIISNLDKWFRRCVLKKFLIWSSACPFVKQSGTISAILVEGIMRNNPVNLFWIWTRGSGDVVWNIFLIWSSGGPCVQWSKTIYIVLKEGIMGNIHVKFYEIWTSGSGGDVV